MKAQSSLEWFVTVSFALIFVIPVFLILGSFLSQKEDSLWQAEAGIAKVGNTVDKIYLLGCKNKIKMDFFSPGLDNVTIRDQEIIFMKESKEIVRNTIPYVFGNFSCKVQGICNVYAYSFSDHVLISQKQVNTSCDYIRTGCEFNSCANAVVYIEPTDCCGDFLMFNSTTPVKFVMLANNSCPFDINIVPSIVPTPTGSASVNFISAPPSLSVSSGQVRKFVWEYNVNGKGSFLFRSDGSIEGGGAPTAFGPCDSISASVD